jgi:hypothetical protein
MLNRHFYHEIIRKTIVGFGTLFNNIELRRVDKNGNLVQTIKVPLTYGPREKFLARIESEPNLDPSSPVQIQLPRIAFEMKGITYDSTRKLSPIQICKTPIEGETNKIHTHYTPVPYNLDFELSIISKNNDDAVQILEQILPFFQPQFNITIRLIEETNELKDIPILLNNVNIQDDYEGDFRQRRALIHTLNFVAKTYLYGPVTTSDVIKRVNTDIGTAINTASRYVRYSATPAALQDYTQDGVGIRSMDVNVDSNTITLLNHGFVDGDFVTYRSDPNGTPIGGLEDLSEYYIIKIDDDKFRLSNTRYNSQRGLSVNLTSQGSGNNHKFSIINFLDDQFVEPDDNFGFNESWTELS